MPKKKTRGGPREGSGRKPVDDPAVPITFYVKQSVVDLVGKDELKWAAITRADELYQKKKRKK